MIICMFCVNSLIPEKMVNELIHAMTIILAAFHKQLKDRVGNHHPNLWVFLRVLKDRLAVMEDTLVGAMNGRSPLAQRQS
jgi:hypothetical protein